MIRPQPCSWFEIMVAREDAFIVLEALAAAGCIEVEWHQAEPPATPQDLLKVYSGLTRKYMPYWPAPATTLEAERRAPVDALASGVDTLKAWAAAADEPIARLQMAEAQAAELALAETALRELADSSIDFSALARAQHGVTAALFALPLGVEVDVPDNTISRSAALATERLMLVIGPPEAIDQLGRSVAEVNGRRARFPDWLQPRAQANLALVAQRRVECMSAIDALRREIDALARQHDVARALGVIARATWCIEHGGAIDQGDVFARITGWTGDRQRIVHGLEASDARALVAFPRPPRGLRAPLILRNPWWAQPFEVFTRLVGMPGASGADPSVLLAFAVPLMFGYMFGDVGQGLVLAAAGWLLRKRMPVLRLLVPGGLAAAGFGLVFGSVFTLEHVIAPWWLHPIEHPLPVLMAPIVAGAALLAIGLLIGALEAWWEGALDRWMREDAPVLLTYVGALAGFVHPALWWLVPVGIGWAVAAAALDRHTIGAAFGALGALVEHTLQLLINTLSFARVGAFALAHAGLSSAVVALADATGNAVLYGLVLVLGNVLILVVEGLVVSIQTTRLVLFEFFTRFFRAEGREFRPLAAPPVTLN